MLTLEARRPGADDVTAVLFPEAIARANGTDVKTAINHFLKEMEEKQASSSAPGAAGDAAAREHSLEALGEALALAGDASSIEMSLVADPAKGLIIRARFNARPGTKLETVAKEVKPFKLDPAVATTSAGGRFLIGGNSIGPFWRGVLATYRDRLAADKQKGAPAALAYYDAVVAALAGQQSLEPVAVQGGAVSERRGGDPAARMRPARARSRRRWRRWTARRRRRCCALSSATRRRSSGR